MYRFNQVLFSFFAATLIMGCGDSGGSKGKTDDRCTDCVVEPGSAELSVGTPSADLIEGAPGVTVALKLKRTPTADVRVAIVSLNQNQVTVEPAELTFGADNWSASQLLTLTAVDDTDVTGDRDVEIEFSLGSDDPGFADKPVSPLVVTVLEDDETPSFDVATDGEFQVGEDGTSITLDITLSAQPASEVLFPIAVDDESEAEIDVTQMTFNTLNWNLSQQVVVTGLDDMENDGDTAFNVVLGPTNSGDDLFNQLAALSVSIINVDGVCGNTVVDAPNPASPPRTKPRRARTAR